MDNTTPDSPSAAPTPLERLTIYVPRTDQLARVAPASVIVGTPARGDSDLLVLDYEGNTVYPAPSDKPRHEVVLQRLLAAAGRHIEQYPTIARVHVPVDHVTEVAVWEFASNTLRVHEPEALDQWLAPLPATSDMFAAAVTHSRDTLTYACWALTRPFGSTRTS